jgi:hypothetical protein
MCTYYATVVVDTISIFYTFKFNVEHSIAMMLFMCPGFRWRNMECIFCAGSSQKEFVMPTSYPSGNLSRAETSQVVPLANLNLCVRQPTRALVAICPPTSANKEPKLTMSRNSEPVALTMSSIERGIEPCLRSESESLEEEKSPILHSSSGTTVSSYSHGVAKVDMGGEQVDKSTIQSQLVPTALASGDVLQTGDEVRYRLENQAKQQWRARTKVKKDQMPKKPAEVVEM